MNDAGEVIGINSFGVKGESQPFNFFTDTDVMRRFMTGNGVSLISQPPKASASLAAQAAGDTTPAGSSSSFPWLGAVAGRQVLSR